MTSGNLTAEEEAVLDEIESEGVDFLRLQFTDILGVVKNVAVPARQAEKAFTEGIYFDGSSIEGFVRIQESDMRLKPDPETFAILPWRNTENGAAARMICDVIDTSTGEPFEGDPRYVLKQALDRAAEMGYTVNAAPEPEFFMFKEDEEGRATTKTADVGGYFDVAPKDLASDVRRDIIYGLESMDFEIEASHHEVAEGQYEINFTYDDALSTADNVATFRTVVRAIAAEHDLHATFMPKPIPRINGSGMHTHISLMDEDGENAFHSDDSEYFNLSDTARSFLAGILEHAPAITAVSNPTVNSYKRLVPGYEAPVYVAWSDRNRSALIRKPAARVPAASRIEARFPDPSCNPYLAFAALIQAGLEGIEQGLEAPEPIRENIYEFDEEKREEYGIDVLPTNLGEAVDALKEDEVIYNALGDHVGPKFVEAKSHEFGEYLVEVSQWELDQYLETF